MGNDQQVQTMQIPNHRRRNLVKCKEDDFLVEGLREAVR